MRLYLFYANVAALIFYGVAILAWFKAGHQVSKQSLRGARLSLIVGAVGIGTIVVLTTA